MALQRAFPSHTVLHSRWIHSLPRRETYIRDDRNFHDYVYILRGLKEAERDRLHAEAIQHLERSTRVAVGARPW